MESVFTGSITIDGEQVTVRRTAGGEVWLTQSEIARLFGVFEAAVRANIREDDRTSSKSVAAQSIDPLGGKKRKSKSGDQGPLNIIVSPLRHTRKNLEQIRDILKRYPGRSKVNLTIKDSLGHSQILELDERFRVNRCPELETELSMYN